MTARDRFTVRIVCPQCGKTSAAKLSQEDGWAFMRDQSTRIEDAPEGFNTVRVSGRANPEFHCTECNVKAPY